MTITAIDIIILINFLFFVIAGFNRGFIKQTSTIVGIIFALIIAINNYQALILYLEERILVSEGMLQFISFTILFILINLFVHLLGFILKKSLDALFLKPIDQAAGAILGVVKGVFVSYFLVLILSHIPYLTVQETLGSSFLALRILDLTPLIQNTLQNIFNP